MNKDVLDVQTLEMTNLETVNQTDIFSGIDKQSLRSYFSDTKSNTAQLGSYKDLEEFQSSITHRFYEMYYNLAENVGKVDPKLIKRSFDDYIYHVEKQYLSQISHVYCDEEDRNIQLDYMGEIIKHTDHISKFVFTLGTEYYALMKVLDVVWRNEHVKKKDVLFLTPCRVFLLGSVVKRKFNEDLDFR